LHKIFTSKPKDQGCKELLGKKCDLEKKIEVKQKTLSLPSLVESQKKAIENQIVELERKKKEQIERELKDCNC